MQRERTTTVELTPDAWAWIEAVGRRRSAEWVARTGSSTASGRGNYPDKPTTHVAGVAGEYALVAWLRQLDVEHVHGLSSTGRDDWDALTPELGLEVKARSIPAHARYRGHVNFGTVAKLGNRTPRRQLGAVVFAVYDGDPATRIRAVELAEWSLTTELRDAKVEHTTSNGHGDVVNRVLEAEQLYPMRALAGLLRAHQLGRRP